MVGTSLPLCTFGFPPFTAVSHLSRRAEAARIAAQTSRVPPRILRDDLTVRALSRKIFYLDTAKETRRDTLIMFLFRSQR